MHWLLRDMHAKHNFASHSSAMQACTACVNSHSLAKLVCANRLARWLVHLLQAELLPTVTAQCCKACRSLKELLQVAAQKLPQRLQTCTVHLQFHAS
jgi:hypothetical protein